MFGHPLELIVILVLALIFFGPEKLPEVAATAGRFVRDMRQAFEAAANPEETTLPDDFSTYYYESVARNGEEVEVEEMPDPADGALEHEDPAAAWRRSLEGSAFHPWGERAGAPEVEDDLDPAAGPPVEGVGADHPDHSHTA